MVVKDFDIVSSIVVNEDFFFVVYNYIIWKFKMFGVIKFVDDIFKLIKNDDSYDFVFYYDDFFFVVDGYFFWMLENVGIKFANELVILVVDLDLVSWISFCDNDVIWCFYNSNFVWIK